MNNNQPREKTNILDEVPETAFLQNKKVKIKGKVIEEIIGPELVATLQTQKATKAQMT
jgi:hypothetical protein